MLYTKINHLYRYIYIYIYIYIYRGGDRRGGARAARRLFRPRLAAGVGQADGY